MTEVSIFGEGQDEGVGADACYGMTFVFSFLIFGASGASFGGAGTGSFFSSLGLGAGVG